MTVYIFSSFKFFCHQSKLFLIHPQLPYFVIYIFKAINSLNFSKQKKVNPNEEREILDTGDTESLEHCGQKHRYFLFLFFFFQGSKSRSCKIGRQTRGHCDCWNNIDFFLCLPNGTGTTRSPGLARKINTKKVF